MEEEIQYLISMGNDEQIVRLTYAVLDGKPREQHVALLQQLGERYLTLAITRESTIAGPNIETALIRLDRGLLGIPPEAERPVSTINWYRAALECFSTVIKQAPPTFDRTMTLRCRSLIWALCREQFNRSVSL